jgi:hypothetical protein
VVAGRGGVPSSATAVSLTVTAWRPTKETEVTAYQAGTSRPATPTLTPSAGRSVSTTTMVPLGAGKLRVWNRSGRTDVVVAVTGWYGKPTSNGAGIYAGTAQARILDTRSGVGGSRGRLGSGSSLALRVHGRGGVPAQASTALLQVTALSPSRSGHLTVWPDGVARPRALTSVAFSRQSETALVLARIGRGGRVRVHNSAGSTHVLVGVVGWYARSGANLSGQTSAAGVLGEVPLDSGTRRAAATGGHRLAQPVHLQGPPDVVARMKQAVRSGALEDFQAGVEQESQSPRTASAAAAYPNFAIWNAGYLQAPPGAPIGRLYSFVGEAWRGSCTATVIARGYVLTAAHCVTDRDGFTFVSSQFGDIDTSRQWFSRDAYVPNGYSDRSQGIGNAMDYAIVKFLPAANGSRWIGDYTGSHKVYMNSPGGTKWSFGYPGEGNFGTHCTGAKCYPYQCYSPVGAYELHRSDPSVSYGGWYTVGFGCYMTGGSSGGPIFEQINGSWYVVSVNSYLGNPAGTYGVAQGCTRPTGECYTYARNMWGPYINEMFNVFYRNVG